MEHDHDNNIHEDSSNGKFLEYAKFLAVISFIAIAARLLDGMPNYDYSTSFMAVFFLVFGSFKVINLREFAYGFQSYDIIAKRSLVYSYSYPFIQLIFGVLYLINQYSWWLHALVLLVSLVSSAGVLKSLGSKNKIHCVCLGSVIKLPLSTISFVEDFGMAIMAALMLLVR